jgi:hypothetical protein
MRFQATAATANSAIVKRLFNVDDARYVAQHGHVAWQATVESRVLSEFRGLLNAPDSPVSALVAFLRLVRPCRERLHATLDWCSKKNKVLRDELLTAYLTSGPADLERDRATVFAFIKKEYMVKAGKARVIVPANFAYQAETAPDVLAVAAACYAWIVENCAEVVAIVGMTNLAKGEYLSSLHKPGWIQIDADLANCDSKQHASAVASLLISLCAAAGCDKKVIDALRMTANNATYVFDTVDGTVKYRGLMTGLRSGDSWTTMVNTVVAWAVWTCAVKRCGREGKIVVLVGGDDACVGGLPEDAWAVANSAREIYAELGHTLEVSEGCTFYSSLAVPANIPGQDFEYACTPMPGKILVKTGFPPVKLNRDNGLAHARGVALCIAPYLNHVPVLRELTRAVVRNTRDVKARVVGESPNAFWSETAKAEANASTMDWFCQRYRTTRTEVEEVETALRAIDRPPPYRLHHPLFARMVEIDTGISLEAHAEAHRHFDQ